MEGKLALTSNRKTSTSVRTSTEVKKDNKPPKGSTIIEKTVRTETEQIENGFIITKSWSGRYIPAGSKDNYGNYFDYNKKWYSKEDPLTIELNDKSLADAFDDSE